MPTTSSSTASTRSLLPVHSWYLPGSRRVTIARDPSVHVASGTPSSPASVIWLPLAPGYLLAMFTDGVTEALGADGEVFGDARIEWVLRLAREGTAEEVLRAVIAAVMEYEGARGPSDDLTAVVVKVYSE